MAAQHPIQRARCDAHKRLSSEHHHHQPALGIERRKVEFTRGVHRLNLNPQTLNNHGYTSKLSESRVACVPVLLRLTNSRPAHTETLKVALHHPSPYPAPPRAPPPHPSEGPPPPESEPRTACILLWKALAHACIFGGIGPPFFGRRTPFWPSW